MGHTWLIAVVTVVAGGVAAAVDMWALVKTHTHTHTHTQERGAIPAHHSVCVDNVFNSA